MESIYQSIELLSKEKGIETQIVLDAVKDALLVVARKHYRTNEHYIAELNEKTGSIDLFAVKKVVEAVENPAMELTLLEARRINPAAELESEVCIPKSTDLLGRISAQTAKQVIFQKIREAEAGDDISGILGARRRTGQLHGQADRRYGPGAGFGQGRSQASKNRAVAPGKLQCRRPLAVRDQGG